MESKWTVYLLRCKDDTLYCGITNDLDNRLEMHRSGKGAKYTRGRSPLELVYTESCDDKSAALKRERAIKSRPRQKKLELIK